MEDIVTKELYDRTVVDCEELYCRTAIATQCFAALGKPAWSPSALLTNSRQVTATTNILTGACAVYELKQGTCRFADEVLASERRREEFERHWGSHIDDIYLHSRRIRDGKESRLS